VRRAAARLDAVAAANPPTTTRLARVCAVLHLLKVAVELLGHEGGEW